MSKLVAQEVHDAYLALASCSFVLSQQFKVPAVSPEAFGQLLEAQVREQLKTRKFRLVEFYFNHPAAPAGAKPRAGFGRALS